MEASTSRAEQPASAPKSRGSAANAEAPGDTLKGSFADKLIPMMYGYGDDMEPLEETVDLVEDIVIEYSAGVLRMAVDLAAARGRVKPASRGPPGAAATAEDVAAVVRRDPRKAARIKELLELAPLLKKARYMDDEEEDLLKKYSREDEGRGEEAG